MSDDEEIILKRALEVSDLPGDYDPNHIPTTGEEYLHSVIYEKKYHCKDILKVNVDNKINKMESMRIEIQKICETAPENILPSFEWQQNQVSEFSSFRLYLENLRNNIPPKYLISTYQGREDICIQLASKHPKTTDIISYNQNHVARLLELHIEWMDDIDEGESISEETGAWLYGLLSRLETPLSPERCHIIRELARKCSEIRSKLDENAKKEQYEPLNLFICLVARYFNQYDLIDGNI